MFSPTVSTLTYHYSSLVTKEIAPNLLSKLDYLIVSGDLSKNLPLAYLSGHLHASVDFLTRTLNQKGKP